MWSYMTQDRPMLEFTHEMYKKNSNEPAVGVGNCFKPGIYVIDEVNRQHVCQTDFKSFYHRGFEPNDDDILAQNLLMLNGTPWKIVRQHMTPLFTANKMKNMYYIIDKSAKDLVDHIHKNPKRVNGDGLEALNQFCCAAIGAAVFGINTKSTYDSPFLKITTAVLRPTLISNTRIATSAFSPKLFKALNLSFFGEYQGFFVDAVKKIIRQREKENVKKHDFADLCVALQKSGMLKDSDTGYELAPTDELLAAQAFFYYIAGVEPCAIAMFWTLVELGLNPDIKEKLRNEIDEAFSKTNGELDYDTIFGMEYLDKVLNESMRKYPPIATLSRGCTQDTVLPVGNIKVEKGSTVFLPIFEIHRDPKLYPNPEVFDPERFADDSKSGDYSYTPFGKGNRICIGMRYARLQVKAGLVHLLRNFDVKTKQVGEIQFDKHINQTRPKNVDFELIPRKF